MARYSATVISKLPAEAVYDYLADFRSAAEWDPSVSQATLVSADDPIRVGARFRVTTKTRLSEVVLEYETIELARPHAIVLRGENESMISLDTISIVDRPQGGSAVTYTADIELKGVRRIADPLLALAFRRLGDRARDGLETKLNAD
jgi:uncharacterized protein YndB with AHSA1/START domain